MENMISELWFGNIAPCEHCGSHDRQANTLIGLKERNRENLNRELSDSQKELLQKYIDASEEYLLRMMELSFREGFCIGSRMTAEVFS